MRFCLKLFRTKKRFFYFYFSIDFNTLILMILIQKKNILMIWKLYWFWIDKIYSIFNTFDHSPCSGRHSYLQLIAVAFIQQRNKKSYGWREQKCTKCLYTQMMKTVVGCIKICLTYYSIDFCEWWLLICSVCINIQIKIEIKTKNKWLINRSKQVGKYFWVFLIIIFNLIFFS